MHASWLLLIYTVPAEPSRKRAYIWREVKKVGAVYLRDGVCILPERTDTAAAMRAIADKVEQFGGQAVVVQAAGLDPARAELVMAQSQAARAEEFREIAREAERFLEHVRQETEHREFTFAELEELEEELGKLRRWAEQVRSRDYFGAAEAAAVAAALDRCDGALAGFLDQTFAREEAEP
jgi:vacuolar-type H+-ATPase subunit I/STV1